MNFTKLEALLFAWGLISIGWGIRGLADGCGLYHSLGAC